MLSAEVTIAGMINRRKPTITAAISRYRAFQIT